MKPVPAHTSRRPRAVPTVLPAQPAAPADLGGRVRVIAQAAPNPQRASEAAAAIRRLGAGRKPSKKHGAAAAIRELRDSGE